MGRQKAKTKRQKWQISHGVCLWSAMQCGDAARQFIFAFWFLPFALWRSRL